VERPKTLPAAGQSRRASSSGMSPWPRCTPSASTSRAIPTSSLITRRVTVPRVMVRSVRPTATISSRRARFIRTCSHVTPHATAASAQRAYPVTGSVNTRYSPCISILVA